MKEENMEFRKQSFLQSDVSIDSDGKSQNSSFVADLEEHQNHLKWKSRRLQGEFPEEKNGNFVFDSMKNHMERCLYVVERTSIATLKNLKVLT